jgi:hypothetical protein
MSSGKLTLLQPTDETRTNDMIQDQPTQVCVEATDPNRFGVVSISAAMKCDQTIGSSCNFESEWFIVEVGSHVQLVMPQSGPHAFK